jgi:hypothetical protein
MTAGDSDILLEDVTVRIGGEALAATPVPPLTLRA